MMKTVCRMTGMLALAFLAAHAVEAQEPVLANIPFAFTAGEVTLPAGEYRVEKLRIGSPVLLIRNTEGKPGMMVMTSPTSVNAPRGKSKLIFHRYGDQYFLSQVWTAGSATGIELRKSAKEKEQGLLARNETPDQVTIVARLAAPKP